MATLAKDDRRTIARELAEHHIATAEFAQRAAVAGQVTRLSLGVISEIDGPYADSEALCLLAHRVAGGLNRGSGADGEAGSLPALWENGSTRPQRSGLPGSWCTDLLALYLFSERHTEYRRFLAALARVLHTIENFDTAAVIAELTQATTEDDRDDEEGEEGEERMAEAPHQSALQGLYRSRIVLPDGLIAAPVRQARPDPGPEPTPTPGGGGKTKDKETKKKKTGRIPRGNASRKEKVK